MNLLNSQLTACSIGAATIPQLDHGTPQHPTDFTPLGRNDQPRTAMAEEYSLAELSKTGSIVGRQSVNLGRRKLRGDRSHAPIDIVTAITRGIHLQLQGEVIPSLLGENGSLDRAARARPVARSAGRDVAAGVAEFDQVHDGRGGFSERRRIGIALRLSR